MTLPLDSSPTPRRRYFDRIAATNRCPAASSGIAANALSLMSVVLFAAAMAVYDVTLTAVCVAISLINGLILRLVAHAARN